MNFRPEIAIALSGALLVEIEPILDLLSDIKSFSPGKFKVFTGKYGPKAIVAIQTGQGAKSAAAAFDYLHENFDIGRQIGFGLAGAVKPGLATGLVMIPDRVCRMGEASKSIKLDPLGRIDGWEGKSLYGGLAVEVQRPFYAQDKSKLEKLGAVSVDMESYTTASLAIRNKVPVSIARVILDESDYDLEKINFHKTKTDDSSKAYRDFLNMARVAARNNAAFLNEILSKILKNFSGP